MEGELAEVSKSERVTVEVLSGKMAVLPLNPGNGEKVQLKPGKLELWLETTRLPKLAMTGSAIPSKGLPISRGGGKGCLLAVDRESVVGEVEVAIRDD